MITTLLLALTIASSDTAIKPTEDMETVVRLINMERSDAGAKPLVMDNRLNYLAYLHAADLVNNHDTTCSLISWSKKSGYEYGCVDTINGSLDIMLKKPKEVLGMKGYGFEMVAMTDIMLDLSKAYWLIYTNRFNRELMVQRKHKRVGVCIYKNVVSVWLVDK